ncbi:DUF1292 domain-containing protein [Weissella diestrammenae]|uniref:UPF0473 protein H9L19_06085 n=1 Tax=Weissella diestrammenae TaxID=1162633 RepID=A0A7G9T4D0_9LACO|nr:DUF1292 domain-containing protein [Weissella diestrammenae]MCM0583491.1 DUF1292 domain-containing protein [Weissella diestrammenae]QNN74955.1 DUF1292 domain-containing protein [Weissella diestrammenae]
MVDDNQVFSFEDEGNTYTFKELFRFEEDTKFNKTYIVLYNDDAVDEEDDDLDMEVQAFIYDETLIKSAPEEALVSIETDDEWEMVTEMINTFFDDPQINPE